MEGRDVVSWWVVILSCNYGGIGAAMAARFSASMPENVGNMEQMGDILDNVDLQGLYANFHLHYFGGEMQRTRRGKASNGRRLYLFPPPEEVTRSYR
ncbi:hypothetical protein SASPL_103038 [Salvia splendens]|uniref:Uncharacterized protein n=1 Tax=Salvia splendens TaxID=180675 RepID=A0A8X9ADB8_SALSN|nr:hypothetical protein SASPL_103038 [Salvia splendens]